MRASILSLVVKLGGLVYHKKPNQLSYAHFVLILYSSFLMKYNFYHPYARTSECNYII